MAQVLALALGFSAVLLVMVLRSDLFTQWQTDLPPNTPNHFAVTIPTEQKNHLQQQLQQRQGLSDYDADVDYDDETKKVIWWNMFVQGTITKLPSLLLTISTVESTSWLTPDEQQILYRSIFPK